MKQNAGLIATLTVFVAFFGLSKMPKSDPGSGSVSETTNKSKLAAKPNASNTPVPSRACEEIRKRLQYLVNQSPPDNWQLPDSCYVPNKAPKGLQPVSAPSGLNFVIATAPNPITTHLPLMFDRMIEVIQQAAQDDRYSYDSSWFPWDEIAKDYPLFGDRRAAEEEQEIREGQPGVVVFRRAVVHPDDTTNLPYDGGLVVFVVAEQPTGGIDRDEFENALAWMERLGVLTSDRGLRILGPSFSGSLASLDQALDSAKLSPPTGAPHIQVSVSSGSVSSELNFLWFQNRMKASHSGIFRTALEGDSLMVDRLLKYLVEQEHYPRGRIAIISEDETAFGTRKVCHNPNGEKLTWQQDWTPTLLNSGGESYRIFGDDVAEGLYIAAREMFDDPTPRSNVPITNYAPPAWLPPSTGNDTRPVTWLSVIGHHQFWPVAALGKYPIPRQQCN